MTKVSIITVNFNNVVGLQKTIKSVVTQTYDAIEYLIIDGGSNDGSLEIIEQYTNHISHWVSEKDNGVYHAMNKGIRVATGDYLLFLNSGDYFYNEHVLSDVSHYLSTKADIVYGDVNVINTSDEGKIVSYSDRLRFSVFWYGAICHQVIFYHKRVFEKAGLYQEQYKITSDWMHYISAIIKHDCTYLHIPVVITNYHLDGMSEDRKNLEVVLKERASYMNKEFPLFVDDYSELNELNKDKRVLILKQLESYPYFSKVATAGLMLLSWLVSTFYSSNK